MSLNDWFNIYSEELLHIILYQFAHIGKPQGVVKNRECWPRPIKLKVCIAVPFVSFQELIDAIVTWFCYGNRKVSICCFV